MRTFSQKVYTLQDCLIYANDNSLENKKQNYQQDIYHQNKIEAQGSFLPSVSASVGGNYSFGRSLDPETNTYQTKTNFNNNYNASLYLPLFRGLVRINNFKYSKAVETMGKHSKQAIKDNISYNVIVSFYNAVYYGQLVAQIKEKLDESENNLFQSRKMEELGVKAGADVAQMEANVAADKFSLIKQENILHNAMIELKSIMNYPPEDSLFIDSSLERLTADSNYDNPDSVFNNTMAFLPKVKEAQYQLKGAKYSSKTSLAGFLPTIGLSAGYGTNYFKNIGQEYEAPSYKNQMKNNAGQYIGLSVSIPIFNSLSIISSKKRAKSQFLIQKINYEQTINQLRKDVESAIADFNGASKEYIQAVKKLNSVEMAHSINIKKFEQGMISALELQNSSNQLSQAKAEVTGMHVQYLIKKMQLDYFKGIPYIKEK
ncbi:MAG: TolC family protein [Bacteroidales bacterium]|nr:TolC family protein [Bacteroidales bacterium]